MIEFRLSLDALGQTRFAYSPLAEVASSLRSLDCQQVGPALQPWLHEVSDVVGSLDLEVLRAVAPPGPFAPHFLFHYSTDPKTTIDQQLARLSEQPDKEIAEDLSELWDGKPTPRPAQLLIAGGAVARHRLIEAIREYWEVAIEPYWSQMRAVLEDDVSYRARQVLEGGMYDLLTDLHPEVSLKSGILSIDKPHLPDESYAHSQLTLIPSIFVWPRLIVAHNDSTSFEVFYAARGVGRVFESDAESETADALGALLGRTRAQLLARLAVPLSTTQLARDLGQSPGTISEHLTVLRRSGLLTSWRSGRSVLYRRTPLASSIIAFSQPQHGSRSTA